MLKYTLVEILTLVLSQTARKGRTRASNIPLPMPLLCLEALRADAATADCGVEICTGKPVRVGKRVRLARDRMTDCKYR
jgi:hypothetical protein